MKANELRIGNYVIGETDPHQRLAIVGVAEIQYSTLFKPILLTEEWLIDFGFEVLEDIGDGVYKNEILYLENHDLRRMTEEDNERLRSCFGVWFGNEYDGVWISDIKYVHQLQNLYFALTNKELTLV